MSASEWTREARPGFFYSWKLRMWGLGWALRAPKPLPIMRELRSRPLSQRKKINVTFISVDFGAFWQLSGP